MKKENTFSTTGSVNENSNGHSESEEEIKVSNEKMLALLKLVYYERKSIKQSSRHLKINYNSAKRIIKNFRRNRISLDGEGESKLQDFVEDLRLKDKKNEEEKKFINPSQSHFLPQETCVDNLNIGNLGMDRNGNIISNEGLGVKFNSIIQTIENLDYQLRNLNCEIKTNHQTLVNLVNYYKYLLNSTNQSVNGNLGENYVDNYSSNFIYNNLDKNLDMFKSR